MSARLRPVPVVRPRAVLYLRQSVARDDSVSLELQEIAGRDHCAREGYDVISVEVDEGISGRTWAKRPAVQRVMDMIEARDADVIVLWKWSRLSRSRKDWALAADRVEVAGGRIESATEPIDTGTASGRFARGVMTEYAAFQSEQIGEQWAEIRARRFNRGLPPHGKLPWGWSSHGDDGIRPDPDAAPVIQRMYQMYLEGAGGAAIARWLNSAGIPSPRGGTWQASRPFTVMDSPIHAGFVVYRGEVREGAHEGIIATEEFARYQQMREQRHGHSKPRESAYLLSSLVRCHCGYKRAGKSSVTSGKLYKGYHCENLAPHARKYISAIRIEAAVIGWTLSLKASAQPVADSRTGDIEHISRELTAMEKRLVALTRHLVDGLVPEATYKQTRDQLESEKRNLTAALAEAERRTAMSPDLYVAKAEAVQEAWPELPFEDKQSVIRSLVAEVSVNADDTVTIITHWGDSVAIPL